MLCLLVHYYGTGSAFVGKSTTSEVESRRAVVTRALESLRGLPYDVDVKVCGIPGASLLPVDVDLSGVADPRHLVYAAIEHLAASRARYDHFLCIEDDVLLTPQVVDRMLRFQDCSEVHEVLLPNRLETVGEGLTYCVDLLATPGWRGLRREFEGLRLDVAQNPHSGLAFLSRRQLDYATGRVDLSRREVIFGGPMSSAFANLHQPFLLWRTRDDEAAHHVTHLDHWTSSARVTVPVATTGRAPAGTLGFVDPIVIDGVICTVPGWLAGGDGGAPPLDAVRLGDAPIPGARLERTPRPDVRAVHGAVAEDSGFRAVFSVLDVAPQDLAAPTLTVSAGDLELAAEWPAAVATRAAASLPSVPDLPFMPAAVVERMQELLAGATCYLEYGTGGTTLLAGRLGVPLAYCVESDPSWLAAVDQRLKSTASEGRFVLLYADVGPVDQWGFPTAIPLGTAAGDYALGVWRRLGADGASPDVVLVDGRFRVACFLASLLRARPGTRIMFDDYLDRAYYRVVDAVVSPTAFHDRTAEFVVPDQVPREPAWDLLARHVGDVR